MIIFFLRFIIILNTSIKKNNCILIFIFFIVVNEWDGSSKLFNNSVKGIWEKSAWSTKLGEYIPKTVLLCNANTTPDAIQFEAGLKSKVLCYRVESRILAQ